MQIDIREVNSDIDAMSAHKWFSQPSGSDTLRLMGNAEHEIKPSSYESEHATFVEFQDLESKGEQVTRTICVNDTVIGIVWIELRENHGIKAPSIHVMIGDVNYRGKGFGRAGMEWGIEYAKHGLKAPVLYSRYLTRNVPISRMMNSLKFSLDGRMYVDSNDLEWQNVRLQL